jgi:hypothetical protein
MVVEKYRYLVLELNARNEEQKRDFLKSLVDNERRQAQKEVLKIINEIPSRVSVVNFGRVFVNNKKISGEERNKVINNAIGDLISRRELEERIAQLSKHSQKGLQNKSPHNLDLGLPPDTISKDNLVEQFKQGLNDLKKRKIKEVGKE